MATLWRTAPHAALLVAVREEEVFVAFIVVVVVVVVVVVFRNNSIAAELGSVQVVARVSRRLLVSRS